MGLPGGFENIPGDQHWNVPEQRLREVGAMVDEHRIVGTRGYKAPKLPAKKTLSKSTGSAKPLKSAQRRGIRAKWSRPRWHATPRR
jgi:hypothetical protein